MTDASGKFTLKNSAEVYPHAGLDPNEAHFAVLLGDQEVGVIYQIGEEWMWLITLAGMPDRSGRADSGSDAKTAFRQAWDAEVVRLGSAYVANALATAGESHT